MKFVFSIFVLVSFSAFAQNEAKLKAELIKENEAKIAKIKAGANGGKLTPEQLWEVSLLENQILLVKQGKLGGGVAGGYVGGMTGGYAGGYVGGSTSGSTGGYVGGSTGGYPSSMIYNCFLTADEKEINCANGKVYQLVSGHDESDRENILKVVGDQPDEGKKNPKAKQE